MGPENLERDETFGSVNLEPMAKSTVSKVQGYLAHKKQPPPPGLSYCPRHGPTAGSEGGAFSYERRTPVQGPVPLLCSQYFKNTEIYVPLKDPPTFIQHRD